METAVTVLRSAAKNLPRSVSAFRLFTDRAIPGLLCPPSVLRAEHALRRVDGSTLLVEWIWPAAFTPDLQVCWGWHSAVRVERERGGIPRMQKLRIVTLGFRVGGRSRAPRATLTTLGFGICPSFKGHFLSHRAKP
jgi:hypothetical protein